METETNTDTHTHTHTHTQAQERRRGNFWQQQQWWWWKRPTDRRTTTHPPTPTDTHPPTHTHMSINTLAADVLLSSRPDGHYEGPKEDCLHYKLPGPPDWVNILWFNMLDATYT
jgi:hypothetical protein